MEYGKLHAKLQFDNTCTYYRTTYFPLCVLRIHVIIFASSNGTGIHVITTLTFASALQKIP